MIGISHENESLPSLGVWIETFLALVLQTVGGCHSLHWECGLKLLSWVSAAQLLWSLPSLGVWIETLLGSYDKMAAMSLPSLGVWIET